jgi:hypothetical protein
MKQFLDALRLFKELWEAMGVAFVREKLMAHGIVKWAVHEDMLDGLQCLSTLAHDLVWSVLRKKPLGVLTNKGMSCDHMVEGGVCEVGKLNCGCVSCICRGIFFYIECASAWSLSPLLHS